MARSWKFHGGYVAIVGVVPTAAQLARALRYARHEFADPDSTACVAFTGEQMADALGFYDERYGAPDAEELRDAGYVLDAHPTTHWHLLTARADYLRFEQGLSPRFQE